MHINIGPQKYKSRVANLEIAINEAVFAALRFCCSCGAFCGDKLEKFYQAQLSAPSKICAVKLEIFFLVKNFQVF